jgi:hypothetical protein
MGCSPLTEESRELVGSHPELIGKSFDADPVQPVIDRIQRFAQLAR